MSHLAGSSAVFSPNSPAVSSRVGVYRPPHLRNRDSVSGLKSSVALRSCSHPSLRGLSRSRESSVSLSRTNETVHLRTVPFYQNESIPEDGDADNIVRTSLVSPEQHVDSSADLIAEETAAQCRCADVRRGKFGQRSSRTFRAQHLSSLEQPLDSASLLAKLRAQMVRRRGSCL